MIGEALDKMFNEGSEEVTPESVVETPQSIEQAPVTEEVHPQPQPTPEVTEQRAQEPVQPPPGYIPLAAVLDEREKRKELERELAQIRSQQAPSNQAPSFYDDPEAFAAYQQEQFANVERNIRFSTSERFAVQAHGSEVVEAAKEWSLTQDPYLKARIRDSQDPIGEAVAQYQRSQMVADPDAWFAQEAAKRGYQQAASAGAVTQAAPNLQPARPAPPRSLASAPSAGRMTDPSNDSAAGGLKFNLDR